MRIALLSVFAAFPSVCPFAVFASGDSAPSTKCESSFAGSDSLSGYFLGRQNLLDATYDSVAQWKKEHHFPFGIGAHHWWHIDRGDQLYGNGYGWPGLRGTYFYWLDFDPSLKIEGDGFVSGIGIHAQGRFRDSNDKFRGFYRDNMWTYEAYAYAKTKAGTFKAGQIVQQFCIASDNSWWDGVSYYDEYRYNPSWGIAWENTWKASDRLGVDTALQYFLQGDRVSGALVNASADTTAGLRERNTGILRVVPTWKLNRDTKLTLGVAGLVRGIRGGETRGVDDTQFAWDTDLTLTWRNFSIWGQYIDSHGVITPTRYVSGGPSSRQNSVSTGVNYKSGPVSAHVNYSREWDHHPGGHQSIFEPGITFQLTKNVTLYTEYVKWSVTNSRGATSKYDDGFEIALVWKF
jgi:hypothetical protein